MLLSLQVIRREGRLIADGKNNPQEIFFPLKFHLTVGTLGTHVDAVWVGLVFEERNRLKEQTLVSGRIQPESLKLRCDVPGGDLILGTPCVASLEQIVRKELLMRTDRPRHGPWSHTLITGISGTVIVAAGLCAGRGTLFVVAGLCAGQPSKQG